MNGNSIADLKATIGVETDKAKRGLESFKSTFESVKQSLSRAKQSFSDAQATIDHFGNNVTRVTQSVQWGFDKLNDGARKIEIKEAFEEQLGGSEQVVEQWLNTLENASSGTVSEFNLIGSASKAMSLGVTDNLTEMESLLEISRFKARKFGTDVSTAFEDISVGVGRQSKLILDNLGIVVDTEQAYATYADSIGKVASQLTDAEKKQAFLNAVLAEGQREIAAAGGLIDSEADKLRILQVEWDKAISAAETYAALTVGRQIAPREEGGTNQVEGLFQQASTYDLVAAATARARQELTGWNEGNASALLLINQTVGSYEALRTVLDQNSQAQAAFNAYILENYAAFGLTAAQAQALVLGVSEVASVYNNASDAMAQYNALSYQQTAAIAELQGAQEGQTQQTEKGSDATYGFGVMAALARGEAAALATQAGILAGELYGVAGGANAAGMALAGAFGAEISRVNSFRLKGGNNLSLSGGGGSGLGGGVRFIFEEQQEAFRAAQAAATSAARSGVSAAEKAKREHERIAEQIARAYESEFNRIAGVAGQQLNFSTSIGEFDALMDRFGVRNQNENTETARRLAAVRDDALKGKRSEWIDKAFPELSGSEGDELAARAQSVLEAYQKGLRPDLINLDSLVAETREALLAQANLKGLQDEAARILMGEGFGADAIAKQFGEKTSEVQGVLAEQLGIASMGAGEMAGPELIDSMAKSMKTAAEAKVAEFEMLGETFGMAIGTGTLRGFSADAIIASFINKMTAAIEAA